MVSDWPGWTTPPFWVPTLLEEVIMGMMAAREAFAQICRKVS
jgi:hypothetical protein